MLILFKTVLTNVSFDNVLFKKEFQKAMNWLDQKERKKLCKWCIKNYPQLIGVRLNALGQKD